MANALRMHNLLEVYQSGAREVHDNFWLSCVVWLGHHQNFGSEELQLAWE